MPARRNYLNIYNDGKTRITNNTPISNFNPQSLAKAFLDIEALELEELYSRVNDVSRAIDPTQNGGRELDKLAFMVGENRDTAVTATDITNTNFKFYIDQRLNWTLSDLIEKNYNEGEIEILIANGYLTIDSNSTISSLIIPKGTIVQNNGKTIQYTTIDDAIFIGTEVYVGVTALSSGPNLNVQTNVLVLHTIGEISLLQKIASFIKCTNVFPIQNGKYSLSDNELKYMISISKSALPGNDISIRKAALSIPGIRDIIFEKGRYGNGTVNILIDSISPIVSNGLIAAVLEKVSVNASGGDLIYVNRPNYIGVELNFNIITEPTVSNPTAIRDLARNQIIQYVNDTVIGGELVWNKMISLVSNITGVQDFIPNYFKLGDYDIMNKINKNQIVLRFANQKAKYNERFYTDLGLVTACVAK